MLMMGRHARPFCKLQFMENIKDIDIKKLELNKGQIEGLPKNPRFIRDDRYKALVKSILDPHYCDVIIARWEKLTGQKAERICDG